MSRLGELLDQVQNWLGCDESDLLAIEAWCDLRIMADDMDRVLTAPIKTDDGAVSTAHAEAPQGDVAQQGSDAPTAPSFTHRDADTFLSHVDGLLIGWVQCGRCLMHVKQCQCAAGPLEPSYVRKWAAEEKARRERTPTPVGTTESGNPGFAVVEVPVQAEPGSDWAACRECGTKVADDQSEPNDDGTRTCIPCLEAS